MPTSAAGSRNSAAITIQRLPCRCCRNVSTYSVQQRANHDVHEAAASRGDVDGPAVVSRAERGDVICSPGI